LPKNSQIFHGLFIPEIPYQFIKRFTKQGETVWDCFGGSGTTKKVADLLKRKCIINDLTPKENFIIQGDSECFNPGKNVQLIILHPPYHNIIKYSNKNNDGSNFESVEEFLFWFTRIAKNVTRYLDKNRFLILICGNIYSSGEEHTLGVWCKDILRELGFKCKSHIIKDYGETKGSDKRKYNLNYYRQLSGNFNNFYGDNIFVLQKN
jgi:DNA modification methylase